MISERRRKFLRRKKKQKPNQTLMAKTGYKKKAEEAGRQDLNDSIDTLETVAAIAAVADQEGGKVLIKGLTEDSLNAIERLANQHTSLSHLEIIGVCASLQANLNLLRTLTRAKDTKHLLETDIKAALEE